MATVSVEIYFEDVAAINAESERVPLEELNAADHIHGGLRIVIGGRRVPCMGYWSEEDVCFPDWIEELDALLLAFNANGDATYTYDEGEQGQPAFRFEKQGASVFFSIVDSPLTGQAGDPKWQQVEFPYSDFREQYVKMRAAFIALVLKSAPVQGPLWLKTYLPNP